MLFRKLTLTNYGLFAGRHEFDLAPRTHRGHARPIVLFGGKNGAGKTTILESIRLALYGSLSLGSRIRATDYNTFLRGRIHRGGISTGIQPTKASIAIEFDHVHRGDADRYVVERTWRHAGKDTIEETLGVTKNGHPLDEVDSDVWPSFVRDIIPEGLAQLFFFDGEKIQELAEDVSGTGALADSIKSLLGLDLVERLDADLTVYANRQVSQLGSQEDQAKAALLHSELGALEAAVIAAQEELASVRTRTDGVQSELRRAEEHLRREGEDLARRRERLQTERTSIATKIDAAEREIRDQCDHLFPLSLCPKTVKSLAKQLKTEQASAQAEQVRAALIRVRADLLKSLKAKKGKRALGTAGVASATSVIKAVFDSRMPSETPAVYHGLSDAESRKTLAALSAARTQAAPSVVKHCADLERWTSRLETIERNLAQIPADEALAPRVEALAAIQRKLGGLDQARIAAEEQLKRHEIDADQKRRELRRLTERHQEAGNASGKIMLAHTVQSALSDYLRALTDRKVAQLRDSIASSFNRLSRKGDIVERVEIDPRTFVVTLYDKSGGAVPKEELSSGEKQIFAIAMLWGLAKTSGRPLPVIIDTPLGRLDSDHRRKLIHDYLPFASHQVIVLSTDTEVDQALFDELRPEISHAYHLSFLPEERRTVVASGYFWKSNQEVVCPT